MTKDYSEAEKWYRKAAEQGFARAQDNLGWMYYKGYGVQQNYDCLLYTSPSPRDATLSRMPSSA